MCRKMPPLVGYALICSGICGTKEGAFTRDKSCKSKAAGLPPLKNEEKKT